MATAAVDTVRQGVIRLELLGEPRLVFNADGMQAQVLERKDAALLALLAIDGAVPRGRAAALLWPDADGDAARNNLRQRLHRLHKRAGRAIAETHNDVLHLAPGIVHDLAALPQQLLEQADTALGELLGGHDYAACAELAEWVEIAREHWRNGRRQALAEIAARLEAEGRVALALQYAERLVADDPLLEHAHRRVMRLHYLRGDRAAALAAYERCRALLKRHLRATPAKETLDLAALIEQSGALPTTVAAPRPVAVLRPPQLVGRAREWAQLEAAWAQQKIVLVSGEPGIGKTRLLSDFAGARAAAEHCVLTGARPGDAVVPYATLARLLQRLHAHVPLQLDPSTTLELARVLPELGRSGAAPVQPLRLQQAVAAALRQWRAAALRVVVLDDLHFADGASLDLLLALVADAARLAPGPDGALMWLFGVRAHEEPAQLAHWRAQIDIAEWVDVRLGPLDAAAITELLQTLALPALDARAWAPPLARHTGGNPLFILETLNVLLAQGGALPATPPALPHGHAERLPVPGNVAQLIERRLGQLSALALKLARVAATAGQDFTVELAAHVLQTHPLDLAEAWRELEDAQIIRDSAFAHDLIVEATQRSVPLPIARLLRQQIAAYLEARSGAPARIAEHWHQAQQWPRAGRAFMQAAEQALAASRRTDEAALLARAIECFAASGDRTQQFAATLRCCEAALHAEDMNRVQALVVALLQLAQTDAERAQARIAEALEANVQVRSAEAEAAARQALAHAERAGDYALRVRASQQLANAWAQLGRTGAAVTLMTPLLDGLRARVDPATERSVLSDFAFVLEHADRRTEAVAQRERIIDLATAQSDWSLAHVALTDQAISVYYLGELERSTALYEQARLLRDRLGPGRGWSVMDDMGLAGNLRELGCYRRALAMTEDALQTMRQGGFAAWALNTENDLAIAYLQLGQTQRAVRLLRELPEDAPAFVHAGRYAARARIERLRKGAAVALWQRALDLAVAAGVRQFVRLKLEIELCRDLEPAAGLPRLDALQAEAQWRECGGLQRLALLYRADALRRSGDTAAAAAAAQAVAAAHTARAPIVIYPAELWWMLFQALDAGGDRSGAEQALRRGYDWIQAALSEVPEEFRDSFLNRNPINRAITLAA